MTTYSDAQVEAAVAVLHQARATLREDNRIVRLMLAAASVPAQPLPSATAGEWTDADYEAAEKALVRAAQRGVKTEKSYHAAKVALDAVSYRISVPAQPAGKWTEFDQTIAVQALSVLWPDDSEYEEERNDDVYNAAKAILEAVRYRLIPVPAPLVLAPRKSFVDVLDEIRQEFAAQGVTIDLERFKAALHGDARRARVNELANVLRTPLRTWTMTGAKEALDELVRLAGGGE